MLAEVLEGQQLVGLVCPVRELPGRWSNRHPGQRARLVAVAGRRPRREVIHHQSSPKVVRARPGRLRRGPLRLGMRHHHKRRRPYRLPRLELGVEDLLAGAEDERPSGGDRRRRDGRHDASRVLLSFGDAGGGIEGGEPLPCPAHSDDGPALAGCGDSPERQRVRARLGGLHERYLLRQIFADRGKLTGLRETMAGRYVCVAGAPAGGAEL